MNYEQTLAEIAKTDENLIVMTAENRAAIRGLEPLMGPRFIDVGIAEQTMIGAAAGLAVRGRVPVVHALATFLVLRAYEFIRTDVGIPGLPVKLVGGVPGFLSEANGPTHQAIEDIAVLRTIPKMEIFCPADEEDLVQALPAIIRSGKPAYIRYNASKPVVAHKPFVIGRAETFAAGGRANDAEDDVDVDVDIVQRAEPEFSRTEGDAAAILTYGFLLKEAMEAKQILEKKGAPVTVINLRTVHPIDEEVVLMAAKRSSLLVTLEDHFLTGGLYSIVAETLLRHRRTAKVLPIALENRWFKPALLRDVLEFEGFTGEQIAQRMWREIR